MIRDTKSPHAMMLVNEVSKLFHDKMRIECERAGINSSYNRILFHLVRNDSLSQSELAVLTHCKPSSISVMLKNMEADELISRLSDNTDMRKSCIVITDKGKLLNEKIFSLIKKTECELFADVSDDEETVLKTILNKILDNIVRKAGNKE